MSGVIGSFSKGLFLLFKKVTFVGTLSGGSFSTSGAPTPRSSKPAAAADGVGISVLDNNIDGNIHDDLHAMEIEEQVSCGGTLGSKTWRI